MNNKIASAKNNDGANASGSKRKRWPTGKPRPVDIHVGSRVKLGRVALGLSQEKLGDAVDLTFQQIQKYERGANRIGASRLYEFSHILDVPVSFFFDDMPDDVHATESYNCGFADQPQTPFAPDPMARREILELLQTYYGIEDANLRKRLFELTKSLALSVKKS